MSTQQAVRLQARAVPWYSDVSRDQWGAFWAVFLGWVVDAFDFNILTFVLIDIQKSFTVDRALAGALGTVTLIMRLVGGTAAGTMADRWGRKLPLILSVLWFSLFASLSGFSTSYTMLFALRALFRLALGRRRRRRRRLGGGLLRRRLALRERRWSQRDDCERCGDEALVHGGLP